MTVEVVAPAADPTLEEPVSAVETPAAPVAAVVPEKYTLALPKDTLLSVTALDRVTATAKALKVMTDADAQSLVGLAHAEAAEVIKTYAEARAPGGAVHKELVKQYEAEALKHPALGNGDPQALERKALQAGLVLNKYAPELAPLLKETGFAARAEVLVFLNRIHDAMSEKSLALPTKETAPVAKPDRAKDMFPNLTAELAKAGIT